MNQGIYCKVYYNWSYKNGLKYSTTVVIICFLVTKRISKIIYQPCEILQTAVASKLQSRSDVKRRNGRCVCADRRLLRINKIESEAFAVCTMIDC